MNQWRHSLVFLPLVLLLSACSHTPAPVVERSTIPRAEIPVDGLHKVNRGDTLHGIAFKYGLDYRDIALWNSIRSPYTIYADQVIRLKPPPRSASQSSSRSDSGSVTRGAAPPSSSTTRTASESPKSSSTPASTSRPASKPQTSSLPADNGTWSWPTQGRLLRTWKADDPARNGVDIAGKEGQGIHAARSGEVVYSGNGLIGYGELIIIKHNDSMLSAYAHNRQRLVAEGDQVSKGGKIAEMGRNGRNETVLHFEIRRDGQPVNPLNYLPKQ